MFLSLQSETRWSVENGKEEFSIFVVCEKNVSIRWRKNDDGEGWSWWRLGDSEKKKYKQENFVLFLEKVFVLGFFLKMRVNGSETNLERLLKGR